jgi:hypothetical protein
VASGLFPLPGPGAARKVGPGQSDGTRAVGKGQTVGWLSVEDGYVRVTCYFAERHRIPPIGDESLAELRPVIAQTPLSGRLLPVTLEVRSASDVGTAYRVIAAKIRLK